MGLGEIKIYSDCVFYDIGEPYLILFETFPHSNCYDYHDSGSYLPNIYDNIASLLNNMSIYKGIGFYAASLSDK